MNNQGQITILPIRKSGNFSCSVSVQNYEAPNQNTVFYVINIIDNLIIIIHNLIIISDYIQFGNSLFYW